MLFCVALYLSDERSLSSRYLTLKQMLPQLELFESGLGEELTWLDEALVVLESHRNVNTLEEVEKELGRYTVSVVYVTPTR